MFAKSFESLRKFHTDEEGLEALQVVMIIAIAAMVMIAVAAIGKAANKFMGTNSNTLFQHDLTTPEGLDGGGGGGFGNIAEVIKNGMNEKK